MKALPLLRKPILIQTSFVNERTVGPPLQPYTSNNDCKNTFLLIGANKDSYTTVAHESDCTCPNDGHRIEATEGGGMGSSKPISEAAGTDEVPSTPAGGMNAVSEGGGMNAVSEGITTVTNEHTHTNNVPEPTEGRTTVTTCLLYTSPSPRDRQKSRMPSSA